MVSHKNHPESKISFQVPPGHTPPTAEQVKEVQKKLAEEASKNGLTIPEYLEKMKAQVAAQKQSDDETALEAEPQPIQPGPPTAAAVAVAKFLKSQDLKVRTCILDGQRKDMFRVKRAFRALQSPAYEKARKRNKNLPEITDKSSLENAFKLLPMSLLALRVSKVDPNKKQDNCECHKTKRIKGLWTVEIEQHQECREDLYFVWFYEGPQIKEKLYAAGAIAIVFTIIMFPLWPVTLRLGVWYLSMGMLGLIGLFFTMAIFRLILFTITIFVAPPGLWLYPNLFEDVGFFDSFRPVWGWQQEKKKGKKKSKITGSANAGATMAAMTGQPAPASASTTSSPAKMSVTKTKRRSLVPKVEGAHDED